MTTRPSSAADPPKASLRAEQSRTTPAPGIRIAAALVVFISLWPPAGAIATSDETIWQAAAEGKIETLRRLIESGTEVNARDQSQGWTPLVYASRNNRAEAVRMLLDAGADPDRCTRFGSPPIAFATEAGYIAVVRLLLERGAEPDRAEGRSTRALWTAASRDRVKIGQLLIEHGAALDEPAPFPRDGGTPLFIAGARGHTAFARMLLQQGANPHQRSEIPQDNHPVPARIFPITAAAQNGRVETIRMLLRHGAGVIRNGDPRYNVFFYEKTRPSSFLRYESEQSVDPQPLTQALRYLSVWMTNQPTEQRHTETLNVLLRAWRQRAAWRLDGPHLASSALVGAAASGELDQVKRLIESEPAPSLLELAVAYQVARQEGRMDVIGYLRPLAEKRATVAYETYQRIERFHKAASEGSYREVAAMLHRGIDPNSRPVPGISYNLGQTALHKAAAANRVEVVELLLEHGADPDATDYHGRRPIGSAIANDGFDAAALLLERQKTVAPQFLGPSLVMLAGEGRTDQVRRVLEKGADVNARMFGWSALTEAARHGYLEVVELLIEHGAQVNDAADSGSAALAWARNQRHDRIASLLVKAGAREADLSLPSPLDLPIRRGDYTEARRLIEAGVGIHAPMRDGDRPLHYVMRRGLCELAVDLLEAGAPLTEGRRVLREEHVHGYVPSSLFLAVYWGRSDVETAPEVVRLMVERGADVDAQTGYRGRNPVMEAAAKGQVELLRILLAQEPDLSLTDRDGRTALDLATTNGHTEAATLLRRAGTKR